MSACAFHHRWRFAAVGSSVTRSGSFKLGRHTKAMPPSFESEEGVEGEETVVVVSPKKLAPKKQAPQKQRAPERDERRQPRYNVLLWDSDDHTFEYVEKMLRELFGHEHQQCKLIAKDVDSEGRAVVLTTTMEHAELKRDQIHAYGRDHLEGSKGSMWSTIEPVE
jgi:ATP-dependent Clp protease adaptor protein ClpS